MHPYTIMLTKLAHWSIIAAGLTLTAQAQAQAPAPLRAASQTSLQSLRSLPPGTQIEVAGGRQVSAQRFVAIADAIRNAKAKPRTPSTSGFARPAGAPAVVLRPGSHVPSVMARADSDIVQLPNGQKVTVGDMKKLAQVAPALKGRPLVTGARGDLQGTAVKVVSARDLRNLRTAPDNTILENKDGVRVTLGELRAHARTQRR
jgi:hypothetical protein